MNNKQTQANISYIGQDINIKVNLIKHFLDDFNQLCNKKFTLETTYKEFKYYFITEYKKLCFECLNKHMFFREKFNSKFYPYVSVNIRR